MLHVNCFLSSLTLAIKCFSKYEDGMRDNKGGQLWPIDKLGCSQNAKGGNLYIYHCENYLTPEWVTPVSGFTEPVSTL